ncbi:hypothetical protein [Tenacibaculum caenipelagi]|uniref:Fibronectin type-III domain-containing protein n=1 Tax=Tenacibaculum caenipelagi TaxID=1325435 RepID=A0A4R6T9G0_9FLAO|nr:hypothetical protein [Tenacibaculum caenipelagi]TDQ21833.1 hypothetical protein DFQ07_2928 [Tenacibaculum caenipelagi]
MEKIKLILLLVLIIASSSCEAIFVENISDKKIVVISPSEGTELNNSEVTFSWNEVSDVDVYHLKIITPNFNNATKIVLDTIVTETLITKNLDSGSYEWSVRGENSGYETQETISSFIIN